MVKNTIFGIFLLASISQINAQLNMLPNGSLEFPTAIPSSANNCIVFNFQGATIIDMGNVVNNWKLAEHKVDRNEGPVLILQPSICNPGFPTKPAIGFCANLSPADLHNNIQFNPNSDNKRYMALRADQKSSNFIFNINNTCKLNRRNHGAVGIALENNATFPQGVPLIIRYKIAPTRSLADGSTINVCNSNLFTHVRFFLSEKGPENWNKNNSDKQELISANFTKNITSITSVSGTDLIVFPCDWQQVERKFTPNQSNFTTLIIYMEMGGCLIDDIEIFPECVFNFGIQKKVYTNGLYEPGSVDGFNMKESASNILSVGNNVDPQQAIGPVTVEFNSKVNFTAGSEIILRDGFSAESLSDFTAKILPCPNSFNKSSLPENVNVNPDPNYVVLPPLLSDEESEAAEARDAKLGESYDINLMPNPAKEKLQIQFGNNDGLSKINIYNSIGQLIYEEAINQKNELFIVTENYKAGIYFVNIINNLNEIVLTKKFVKE
ncbi:MAG: T9SS type A sorting domain-containing protein [Bacteroidota bacterium]